MSSSNGSINQTTTDKKVIQYTININKDQNYVLQVNSNKPSINFNI